MRKRYEHALLARSQRHAKIRNNNANKYFLPTEIHQVNSLLLLDAKKGQISQTLSLEIRFSVSRSKNGAGERFCMKSITRDATFSYLFLPPPPLPPPRRPRPPLHFPLWGRAFRVLSRTRAGRGFPLPLQLGPRRTCCGPAGGQPHVLVSSLPAAGTGRPPLPARRFPAPGRRGPRETRPQSCLLPRPGQPRSLPGDDFPAAPGIPEAGNRGRRAAPPSARPAPPPARRRPPAAPRPLPRPRPTSKWPRRSGRVGPRRPLGLPRPDTALTAGAGRRGPGARRHEEAPGGGGEHRGGGALAALWRDARAALSASPNQQDFQNGGSGRKAGMRRPIRAASWELARAGGGGGAAGRLRREPGPGWGREG